MSSYIDLKFISNLKSRLSQFKQKNDYCLILDAHIVVTLKNQN